MGRATRRGTVGAQAGQRTADAYRTGSENRIILRGRRKTGNRGVDNKYINYTIWSINNIIVVYVAYDFEYRPNCNQVSNFERRSGMQVCMSLRLHMHAGMQL